MSLAAQSDSSYFRRFVGAIREGYDGFSKAIKRRKPQRGGSIGEATLGAATSSGGAYAWPAAYGAEKLEQVRHFRLWRYIAIRAIAETMARHLPQVGLRRKPGQVEKGNPRVLNSLLRQKALVSMAAHEEIEACDSDHPLSMLLRNPNRPDTGYTFWYRKPVFLELTGESYAWKVRNRLGEVVELWELFPQWVTPRPGSQRLIDKYEIRPYGYGGSGGSQMFEVDPDDMIALRYPSPLTMLNGWSPTQACAEWGDVGEAIDASRWYMFENGSRPDMVIETDAAVLGNEPFKAHQLAAFYAQFEARMRGRENNGKPIVMNPGMKAAPWAKTAVEMDYYNSAQQNSVWQRAIHRVSGTICGVDEDESYASARTHLANFLQQTMGPKYTFIGEVFTEQLASEWGDDYMIYWPDMTPTDPEQLNADIETDMQCILPGQELAGQVIGASKAWYEGQVVEIRTSSGAKLAVTTNHPVMTVEGFVPAGQLAKGNYLLRYRREHKPASSSDDVQHAPTVVEKVFESLANVSGATTAPEEVRCSAFDFHGDAKRFKGNVQVVGSYGQLRRNVVAETAKRLNKCELDRAGPDKGTLASGSNPHFSFDGHDSAFVGDGLSLCKSFLGSGAHVLPDSLLGSRKLLPNVSAIHAELGSFGSVPNLNAESNELASEPDAANTNFVSQFLNGQSAFVSGGENSHIRDGFGVEQLLRFGSAANLDTSLAEFAGQSVASDSLLARKLRDRFPSNVTTDQIVNIREFHYSGPVYDFESPLGYIVVESLLLSNCGARTPNEVRKARGLEPYPHGGDNPIIGGIEMPWVDKGAETAYQWDQSDEQVNPGDKPKDEEKPATKDDDKDKSFHRNGHGLPNHLLQKSKRVRIAPKRLA